MEVWFVPIYEYQCIKCGEVFEAFQKITDDPLTQCKFCQAGVERLISQTSFQLKGSGWYLTDYARRSLNGSSDNASKKSEGSEKATETKASTESKSAEKSSEIKT